MPNVSRNRILTAAAVTAVAAFLTWLAWPGAVPVDLAQARRGPMTVTVDEEARTRVHNVYTISAPLSGTVLRADREVGDPVIANQTVVAVMRPSASNFHDPRLHQELVSALAAADAAVALADAERQRIAAAVTYSNVQLKRMKELAAKDAVAPSTLDKAIADARTNQAALASAIAALQVRRNERASAAARLEGPAVPTGKDSTGCCIEIRAPVTGQVLQRFQASEAVVAAGAPLFALGDPQDLEIFSELLSTDAVQVRRGASVRIDGWGGTPLRGRVRLVEPAGFLKVSALGIEEQRVRAIIDFADPPARWQTLGHDYRVIVHIATWQGDNVLAIPVGALFRTNDKWTVFRNMGGRARVTEVAIGHRNSQVAEVLSGLSQGDEVVLHPSDRVADGTRIVRRQ